MSSSASDAAAMASFGVYLRIMSASDQLLGSGVSRQLVETFPQSPIQDFDGAVDLLGRDGQRRRDAPHRSALGAAADVHAQPILKTLPGRQAAELVGRAPAVAIGDQLDAEQEDRKSTR